MEQHRKVASLNHPQFEWVAYRLTYSICLEFTAASSYGLAVYIEDSMYGLISWTTLLGVHVAISSIHAWYFGANVSQPEVVKSDVPCVHPAIPAATMFSASMSGFILPNILGQSIGTEHVINFVLGKVPEAAVTSICMWYGVTYLYSRLFSRRPLIQLHTLPGGWLGKQVADQLSNVMRKSIGNRRKILASSFIDPEPIHPWYQYSKIDPNTIRLVRIEVNINQDAASCELISVPLSEAPPYTAVSYRWGEPRKLHTILAGKNRIAINQAVHDLVGQICPVRGVHHFWIDSICIDQANSTEKEAQIPIMGEIYEGANEVVVFLGLDDEAERACNLAHRTGSHLLETRHLEDEPVKRGIPFKRDVLGLRALTRMFENEYWSRTWIIQEFALSKNLRIRYGNATISWVCISAIIQYYDWRPASSDGRNGSIQSAEDFYLSAIETPLVKEGYLRALGYARHLQLTQGRNRSLASLVSSFCRSDATQPEHKVYGLLGFSDDSKIAELAPDFSLSPWQVYARLTAYEMKSGGYELLNLAGLSKRREGFISDLPSWVPDLHNPPLMIKTTALWGSATRGYAAGVTYGPIFDIIEDGRVLKIQGAVIDVVQATTDKAHRNKESERSMASSIIMAAGTTYRDMWRMRASKYRPTAEFLEAAAVLCVSHSPDLYLGTEAEDNLRVDRVEAFWRTLCLDFDGSSHPASPAMYDAFRDFVAQTDRGALLYCPKDGKLMKGWSIRDGATFWKRQLSLRWGKQFDDRVDDWFGSDRQFAVSLNGYFAIVPEGTRNGDVLVMLDGLPLPYVLRPLEGSKHNARFELWGEAFVYGIMRGEADDCEREWFEIC
jgi:hypothetical protein